MAEKSDMQLKEPPILWRRGALWLAFLGPFFFISYGLLNQLTSIRPDVGVVVQDWERAIPFVPWMMLPYMSIDAFYAASLFLFRKRSALDRHALRLLMATVISLVGFLLFPLQFSFAVPKAEGFNGFLQAVLLGFDKPYNQAPSLHISLLIVLWMVYAKRLQGFWQYVLHAWFFAIAASVLLVYQHHFIDVWTGALAGVACLYFIPDKPFFWRRAMPTQKMIKLAKRYASWATVALAVGLALHSLSSWFTLMLSWVAMALALVAAAYWGFENQVFQRHRGRMRWPARIMLAPYLLGSWLSYLYYTQQRRLPNEIHRGVWLGAFPNQAVSQMGFFAVLDLTSEFTNSTIKNATSHRFLPMMDLIPLHPKALVKATRWLHCAQISQEKVLVHCALGLSRSASVVVCWLVWQKHAGDIRQAVEMVNRQRSGIVISSEHIKNIDAALAALRENDSI
ncbi:MAG TPA: phosphatase PAP2/dual specificity phosphatase family protein [Methylotenera sp.]|nr:phosphatase PAP2/dual specificity phosphatase family protein [Methylotenera sp.]HPH05534.1 phosphatase PAP2/dual specificity phosphatase family protein [Methylotenera sp.]HPN00052.1 phosphatase PAP2/dual specificity phosphatase family protein [Methylotenera sp.]